MARINVEQSALTDPRFELLGGSLKSCRYDALGRMIYIWNLCQERSTYFLSERLVGAIMGSREGAQWLVDSALAEWKKKPREGVEGVVRIKGTEGRIEWLAASRDRARENGKRGGRPKRNQERTEQEPTGVISGFPAESPLTLPPPLEVSQSVGFDPIRESEKNRKAFEAAWNAAGLRPLKRLTHTLHTRFDALLLDREWAESWREALTRAGQIPFLATGEGRQRGPLDPSDFLHDDDFAAAILRGKYDPRTITKPPPGGPPPAPPPKSIEELIVEEEARTAKGGVAS